MSQSAAALRGPSSAPSPRGLIRGTAWAAALAGIASAVALLDPMALAIVVAGIAALTLALIQPLSVVAMLLFSVPLESLAQVEAGSFKISPTEPLVALLGLAWSLHGVLHRGLRVRGGAVLVTSLLLIALMTYSITYAISIGPAVKETLKWLELLILVVVVGDLASGTRRVAWLLAALFAASSLESLFGVAQVALGVGPVSFETEGGLRAYGHFDQPNPFAGYLATVLPVALTLALAPIATKARLLCFGVTGVLAGGILLSQSRGAWLGLALALLLLVLLWNRRALRLIVPLIWAGALVVVLAAAGFLPAAIVERVAQIVDYFGLFDVRTVTVTDQNWAVVERMAHWQAAWGMFLANPWLGVGAGNYAEAYPDFFLADWSDPLGHAHNFYLNTLAELGVVGLILLLTFFTTVFGALWRGLSLKGEGAERPFWRALLIGVICSLAVFCLHNLFDNLFVHSVNVQIGFLIALGLIAVERLRTDASPVGVALG